MMEPTNKSYAMKYTASAVGRTDLVWARGLGLVLVEPGESVYKGPAWPHDEWMMLYTYWMGGVKGRIWGEQWHRKPTLLEWLWYKHPQLNKWRVGKTPFFRVWFAMLVGVIGTSLALIAYGAMDRQAEMIAWITCPLFILGIPAIIVIGAIRNYNGKQL